MAKRRKGARKPRASTNPSPSKPPSKPAGKSAGGSPGKPASRSHGAADASKRERGSGRSTYQIALLSLATAGIALTAYLTLVKMFGAQPLACGADSSCDVVQSSRWSTLLRMPLSFWGLLAYATIAGLLWRAHRRPARWRQAWVVALAGVAISVYLTVVSVVEIEATCMYCLASLAILTLLAVGLSWRLPQRSPGFGWVPWGAPAAGFVAIGLTMLHLHYAGIFDPAAGPEKPYLKALATHLADSDATFYGAYWCPHCQEQKALFEASVSRLPYVECTPSGRSGPKALACVTANIESYPTWVIGTRRFTGILTPDALARYSRFEWKDEVVAEN